MSQRVENRTEVALTPIEMQHILDCLVDIKNQATRNSEGVWPLHAMNASIRTRIAEAMPR